MPKTLIGGFLCIYSAQGVASCWALQGGLLHILKDGDHLTILSKDDLSLVLWSGTIKLFKEGRIYDKWLNADEAGIDHTTWWKWFREEHPAQLVVEDGKRPW